jgi:hypothetical protein
VGAPFRDGLPASRPVLRGASSTLRLVRALWFDILDLGVMPYLCGICCQPPEWNGEKLVLPIDHINGDPTDNRPENLRFLCPNCHSQTETFAGRNIGRVAMGNGVTAARAPLER